MVSFQTSPELNSPGASIPSRAPDLRKMPPACRQDRAFRRPDGLDGIEGRNPARARAAPHYGGRHDRAAAAPPELPNIQPSFSLRCDASENQPRNLPAAAKPIQRPWPLFTLPSKAIANGTAEAFSHAKRGKHHPPDKTHCPPADGRHQPCLRRPRLRLLP